MSNPLGSTSRAGAGPSASAAVSSSTILVIVMVIIIALAAIIGITYFTGSSKTTTSSVMTVTPEAPQLSVTQFLSQAIYANGTSNLSLTLTNSGSAANAVVLTLNSQAFGSAQSAPQDVATGAHVTFSVPVQGVDETDEVYSVAISASYSGPSGSQSTSLGSGNVVLGPMVSLTKVGWFYQFPALSSKSAIGRNDSTDSYVTVQSSSRFAQYSQINITETFEGDHTGLTIAPVTQSAGIIGPQGESQQLTFKISSTNAPSGTYPILIRAWAFNVLVAQFKINLSVSG